MLKRQNSVSPGKRKREPGVLLPRCGSHSCRVANTGPDKRALRRLE